MTPEARTRILVTQREELGDRAADALGRENVSPWNTEWEIDGRFIEAIEREAREFYEIVAGLHIEAVAS